MAESTSDPAKSEKTSPKWRKISYRSLSAKALARRVRQAETKTTRHAKRFIVGRIDSLRAAREHVLAWFLAVGLVLAAILGQFMISGASDMQRTQVAGGTYAEGVVGDIRSLNPLYASTSAEVSLSKLLFSSLFRYDASGSLHRDLAASIEVNDTATTYTVTIRRDAVWQDSAPITADDVVYTINTIKNPEARATSSLQNNWSEVAVKKIDDYTVQFTLPAYASFAHALTFPILPSHLLQDVPASELSESGFSQSPVGSGPFIFKLAQNAQTIGGEKVIHMLANTQYYEGSPRVTRFELHAYQNLADLVKALKTDELSGASDVMGSDIDDISDSRYVKDAYPINNGVYALMNNAQGIFTDANVRKAIQAILDTAAIRESAGDGVKPLYLPFIASQVSSAKLPSAPIVDVTAAAKLLEASQWQRVDGTWTKSGQPLAFTITTTKNDQYERVANTVASQLRAAGMRVLVSVIDDTQPSSNFVSDVLQNRNYDMLVYELQIGGDPDVYAYWHSSQTGNAGYNFASYQNDTADAALISARDRTDEKLRDSKYALFAKQWLADAPAVGLYQQVFVYAHKPGAQAMDTQSEFVSPSDRYARVQDWTVTRQDVYKTP